MIRWLVPLACLVPLALPPGAEAARRRAPAHEPAGVQLYASPQSNPIAVSPDGSRVLVASTTSGLVDVINTSTNSVMRKITVGIDPVAIAFRPDGSEAWVSNHVSDSVSVIDMATLQVVETVQELDGSGVTLFDEPVGIAFKEDGSQAYVALSSRNQVAVVDTSTYQVSQHLDVNAQDPRALSVHNGRLYVAAFESDNGSELSSCENGNPPPDCTLGDEDLLAFAQNPNLPNETKNILFDPQRPDRDLFVWDTSNLGAGPQVVEGIGTLLYGVAVAGSAGNEKVFVTQADARNAENGLDDQDLEDLQNRMFLNRVAAIDCTGGSCSAAAQFELDPPVGTPPAAGTQLATPYGLGVFTTPGGDFRIVGSAAASSRIFVLEVASDLSSASVLDRLDVGEIPRGVALRDNGDDTHTVWVLNTLDNSVTLTTVSASGSLAAGVTIPVGQDSTPEAVRLGRIAFNDADASSEGTFACASCHPDGNTDQLIWRIGGQCTTCAHDEPRTTMPIRGLRDALPLHWDGTLGDPFGGVNGSGGSAPANCTASDPQTCFRQLVDASLEGVMCDQPCANGPSGSPGLLTDTERDDMGAFLESVSYPPARERALDDAVSVAARDGFDDFFRDQAGIGDFAGVNTCADSNAGCHELPLGTSTNSETVGSFDAPTMRGMTDRFVHFSNGITGSEEMIQFQVPSWDPATDSIDELVTFSAAFPGLFTTVYGTQPDDIFQMFEEASTGHSGALGRQVTLNLASTVGCPACPAEQLLAELEAADGRGVVNLQGFGRRNGANIRVSYLETTDMWRVGSEDMTRGAMIGLAQTGELLATLTASLRSGVTSQTPQPLIGPVGSACNAGTGPGPNDDPALPTGSSFQLEAAHVSDSDVVFLDGQPTTATITILDPNEAICGPGDLMPQRIQISGVSQGGGLELLQIRSTSGLLSNEVPLP